MGRSKRKVVPRILPDEFEPVRRSGRRSMKDIIPKDTWTVFKIMGEFVEGGVSCMVLDA